MWVILAGVVNKVLEVKERGGGVEVEDVVPGGGKGVADVAAAAAVAAVAAAVVAGVIVSAAVGRCGGVDHRL